MLGNSYKIENLHQLIDLWTKIYKTDGKPNWSHILPYYDKNIFFKDSIQEIHGIDKFAAMTKRLTRRSKSLDFIIHNSAMSDNTIFIEWEMVISYKKFPKSSLYGSSFLTLYEGKIIKQRDYYDLWGDIFDNIPLVNKFYRRFIKSFFG